MADSKIRLGTFRIPETTWKDFMAKAHSNSDNASSILLNTVHAYLNSEINSASTVITISSTPTNASPSSNTATALTSNSAIAISSSPPLPLPTPTNSPVSILLAIAPDNQILYIDRGIPQYWNPPYNLRNANPDYRLEFLTTSDSSILPAIEDILIKTFKPPFNFKTNLDSLDGHIDKELQPAAVSTPIPLHISDRIHSLLTNGLSPEDIHYTLNTLHLQHLHTNPNPEQINSAIASLTNLTDRISAIQENLIQVQMTNSQKHTKPKSVTIDPKPKPKPKPLPLSLKGTASAKELPPPLGTTELAQRLEISVKRLEKVRSQYKNSTEGFFKYTFKKENAKFGWIYDPTKRLHIPYLELPTSLPLSSISISTITKEIQTLPLTPNLTQKPKSTTTKLKTEKLATKSKLTKTPKPKPLPDLNQSQLANRFGLNPCTLSRKRLSFSNGYISAQDFDSWCRSKDPDNFAWTYSEDSQDYTCKP